MFLLPTVTLSSVVVKGGRQKSLWGLSPCKIFPLFNVVGKYDVAIQFEVGFIRLE